MQSTSAATDLAATCPKYFVHVIRGSGEKPQPRSWHGRHVPDALSPSPQSHDVGQIPDGLGVPGEAFARAFADTYTGGVLFQANGYSAIAVKDDPEIPVTGNLNPRLYASSVEQGAQTLERDLREFRARCDATKSRIVVVGYSQGADVLHGGSGYLDKYEVSDVVLFGDPRFCTEKTGPVTANVKFSGDFDPHKNGVRGCAGLAPFSRERDVWSYCHAADRVCQGGGSPVDPLAAVPWYDDGPHLTYHTLDSERAARRVLRKYAAVDEQSPRPSAVYLSCAGDRLTVAMLPRVADAVVIEAEGPANYYQHVGTVVGTGIGETRQDFAVPVGAETVTAYPVGVEQDPKNRLDVLSVKAFGCQTSTTSRDLPDSARRQLDGAKATVCKSGEHLDAGSCVPVPVRSPVCKAGERVSEGKCVPDASPLVCKAGEHVSEGKCVPDAPAPLVCKAGEHVSEGKCVPDAPAPLVCKAGEHVSKGKCVPDAPAPLECKAGEHVSKGKCVPDAPPQPKCQAGERLSDGKCVPKANPITGFDKSSGPPGSTPTLEGSGFYPNKPVTVTESGPAGKRSVGTITTDSSGRFVMHFQVGNPTPEGRVTLTFRQEPDIKVTDSFYVTACDGCPVKPQ